MSIGKCKKKVKIIPRKILVKSSYEPIYEEQFFIIFLSYVWLFTKIRYKTFAIKFLCFFIPTKF